MRPPVAMRAAWMLAACLAGFAAAGTAAAQDPAAGGAPDPAATPQPDATVRDPEFGVAARHFGLERVVEMFQWTAGGDGGYTRAWSAAAVDSSGFAPGHENPPLPLRSRRWTAAGVSVDGVPLDPAVIGALGRWAPFRPAFSALPGNLAATFQPQGDGLGTAENPMAPEIGDLRIRWRELQLPPLSGRIALQGGRWVLRQAAVPPGDAVARGAPAPQGAPGRRWMWWMPLVLVPLWIVVALAAGRRRASRRDGKEP